MTQFWPTELKKERKNNKFKEPRNRSFSRPSQKAADDEDDEEDEADDEVCYYLVVLSYTVIAYVYEYVYHFKNGR